MHESPEELRALQDLLDRSFENAGTHIRRIFTDKSRVSASELVSALPGIFEMHLATTTAHGAPIVAPIDAAFFRGKIWFGLPAHSVRSGLVRRDPRVSASYTRGESFAFIVHGHAREVSTADPQYDAYSKHVRNLYIEMYGPRWAEWYETNREQIEAGYHAWIEPRRIYVKG